jgi:hypothetical protein
MLLAAVLVLGGGLATNPDGTTEYKRTAIGALGGAAVADNATPEGRSANRRVQLEIRPNEKLKAQQNQ